MSAFTNGESILPAGTRLGVVGLTVADLDRSLQFYREGLGLEALDRSEGRALLGSATSPLIEIVERPGARPKPPGATGLFHVALLLPTRRDLGRLFHHLLSLDYPIDGAADHLVSEALYLTDPDGNGIELYRDRPRTDWRWENGMVRMASDPFDARGVLSEAAHGPAWEGIAPETRLGHVHLQVGDVAQAQHFYVDVIGFGLMATWSEARFVAAGGYHHHLGLNSWRSRNGPPPPSGSAGLRYFTLHVPDAAARAALAGRLAAAGLPLTEQGASFVTADPWGNQIVVEA
jgi:catechol 2,3-dioxygenase